MSDRCAAPIGELATFVNGAAFKPEDWGNEGQRIIRIQNLTDPDKPFNRTHRELSSALQVEPGDILVSWSASLGVFEWQGPDVGLLNQHIFRVLPDERRVEKRYLRHGLELALQEMARHLHGATMKHVNRGEFLSTKIYVPPLAEQRRIAAILDQAEALRAKRRQSLARLDALTQSIFIEMFGDPATNPKGWPVASVGHLLAIAPSYGTMLPPSSERGDWLSIRVANIQDWTLDLSDSKYVNLSSRDVERHGVQDGDLLMARAIASREHLGKAIVVEPGIRKWAFDSHLMRLRFDLAQAEPQFIRHLLMTQGGREIFLKATRRSAVQFNINTGEMRRLTIPLPPVRFQRNFVSFVSQIDGVLRMHNESVALLDHLFASLQHWAFRGEL